MEHIKAPFRATDWPESFLFEKCPCSPEILDERDDADETGDDGHDFPEFEVSGVDEGEVETYGETDGVDEDEEPADEDCDFLFAERVG